MVTSRDKCGYIEINASPSFPQIHYQHKNEPIVGGNNKLFIDKDASENWEPLATSDFHVRIKLG